VDDEAMTSVRSIQITFEYLNDPEGGFWLITNADGRPFHRVCFATAVAREIATRDVMEKMGKQFGFTPIQPETTDAEKTETKDETKSES
jgi:hypothetical protein